MIVTNPQLYANSRDIYSVPYWYLYGPSGLTQVTFGEISEAYLVWNEIPEAAPPWRTSSNGMRVNTDMSRKQPFYTPSRSHIPLSGGTL